jgi:hypothetical protein
MDKQTLRSVLKEAQIEKTADGVTAVFGAVVLGILERVLDGPPEQTHERCVREREETLRVMRECGWKGDVADPQITDGDVTHLEACEKQPFAPLGWLYTNVFEGLRERGLVHLSQTGYALTPDGHAALLWARAKRENPNGTTEPAQ